MLSYALTSSHQVQPDEKRQKYFNLSFLRTAPEKGGWKIKSGATLFENFLLKGV
jgi:hypothetical protein